MSSVSGLIFEILCGGVVIGTTRLEGRDLGMGVAYGAFEPVAAYATVQPVFRMFALADQDAARLKAYYAELEKLDLCLRTQSGLEIETTTIHISDYSVEVGADALEVEVHLASPDACRKLETAG